MFGNDNIKQKAQANNRKSLGVNKDLLMALIKNSLNN